MHGIIEREICSWCAFDMFWSDGKILLWLVEAKVIWLSEKKLQIYDRLLNLKRSRVAICDNIRYAQMDGDIEMRCILLCSLLAASWHIVCILNRKMPSCIVSVNDICAEDNMNTLIDCMLYRVWNARGIHLTCWLFLFLSLRARLNWFEIMQANETTCSIQTLPGTCDLFYVFVVVMSSHAGGCIRPSLLRYCLQRSVIIAALG